MDVQEVLENLEQGIMVCKPTLIKLAKAAVMMEDHLLEVRASERDGGNAADILQKVADL